MAWTGNITTLIAPVPEVDGTVERWRRNYDWSARAGVPSHITLLSPFLQPDKIGSQEVNRLDSLFAACQQLRFTLVSVKRIWGVVYLAPRPVAPFRQLTRMLQSEWPETRALGEVFRRRLYHLTVARDRSVFERDQSGTRRSVAG
jgi:hypothetical protein